MPRDELLEWIALIVVIVAWWPGALFGWFPLWYKLTVYIFSLGVVGVILVRRVRKVRENLRYSREIMEAQRRAQPRPPLEGPPGGQPPPPDSEDED